MRIAFATCAALPDGWEDDHEAACRLSAEYCVWNDPDVDWAAFDRVVIRSTWDYSRHVEEFVAWAERVGPERLRNPPALVAFNVDKRYLGRLACRSVPTTFLEPGDPPAALAGEVVVKPNVSAGARTTGRFGPRSHSDARALIERIHGSGRVALVQPYMSSVEEQGETALVFIGGELSHVLRKRPVLARDEVAPTTSDELEVAVAMLREDLVRSSSCSEAELVFARQVLAEVVSGFGVPLYARVDLVSDPDGRPLLLELEAVEPNLYLREAPGATERLVACVLAAP
jgi:hypothetical protein